MNQNKYVFAQVVEFLDRNHFNYLVRKYNGDRYVKSYSVWNQLLTLIFGQLSRSPSMRDCVIALQAHRDKLYHLGIGKNVTRSNLSKAKRTCVIYSTKLIFKMTKNALIQVNRYCLTFNI